MFFIVLNSNPENFMSTFAWKFVQIYMQLEKKSQFYLLKYWGYKMTSLCLFKKKAYYFKKS